MRSLLFPQPLDLLGSMLAAAGVFVLVGTGDPQWTGVLAVAVTATALAGGDRAATQMAWSGRLLAVLGWFGSAGWDALTRDGWQLSTVLTWLYQAGVLGAALALALLLERRAALAAADVQRARAQASAASVLDAATGLANRKGLAMLADPILQSARRRGDAVYCVFVDVAASGGVDDDRAAGAGDEVVLAVADALTRSTRATDAVARWSADQFVVVGPGTGLPPLEIERRVRSRCRDGGAGGPSGWEPCVSAGGAVLEPWDDGDVDSLLRQAGREMQVRRALRREAAAPTYEPPRTGPSGQPRRGPT